jgi:aspartyl/asparaginyl beta-hydroxylase (cupin superfamily)
MRPIILFLTACALTAAEPDWTRIDREALELFQRYVRIASVKIWETDTSIATYRP